MQFYLELFGYFASALVVVSLMMKSLLKLRAISLLGSSCFIIYGILINAYPIVVMNVFILSINVYYLRQMLNRKEYFNLLDVSPESAYLRYFLDFHRDDIHKLIPEYRFQPDDKQLIIFVLRDMVPAGLFIGERREEGFLVFLDYVIPAYRDYKIGRYLYQNSEFFATHEIDKLISKPNSDPHEKYLHNMGFQQETNDAGQSIYSLTL